MHNMILLNKFLQYWIFPFPKSSIKIWWFLARDIKASELLPSFYYMVCVWLRILLTDSPPPLWEAEAAELLRHIPALLRIKVPICCQLRGSLGADTASLLLCVSREGKARRHCFFPCFTPDIFQSISPNAQMVRAWAKQGSHLCSWPGQGPLRSSQRCWSAPRLPSMPSLPLFPALYLVPLSYPLICPLVIARVLLFFPLMETPTESQRF